MRIGLIAPPWLPVPPLGYGGTELVIDLLARGLRDRGHQVTLFTTGDSECPVPCAWEYRHALSTRSGTDHAAHVRHIDAAYRHMAEVGVDVIHDHTALGPSRHTPAVPVVATMHGVMDGTTRQLCDHYPTAVSVVAISTSQRDSAPEVPFRAVIHHGIDVAHVPVGAGGGGYLLFLGRMSPTKGARTAIEIARAADLPLVMAAKVSDESEEQYFAQEIQPLLSSTVTFIGEAHTDSKQHLLGEAVALLNPIKWREPFGLVMIEALAAGTPVIATAQGAAAEIIDSGTTGFVCHTLSDAVGACHAIADLSRADCRAAAEDRFSADLMVSRHEALYLDLVRERIDLDGGRHPKLGERRHAARGLFARRDACPDCGHPLSFGITRGHVILHCDHCGQEWGKDLGTIYRLTSPTDAAAAPSRPRHMWGSVRRPPVRRSQAAVTGHR